MSISLQLNRDDNTALYRQIAEHVKTRIGDGHLPAGTRLPTVRKLATELGVTRLTVQNAYSELQSGGWIEATVGRGTFVSQSVRPLSTAANMANGGPLTHENVIDDILNVGRVAGIRSMAGASPDNSLLHAEEFWACFGEIQRDADGELFSYESTQGNPQLRIEIAEMLRDRHLNIMPDDVVVTNGLTQGLSMVTQALAQPGDTVLVEQPTYLGLLNVLKAQRIRAVGIPLDACGPDMGALERAVVEQRPRFFYSVPAFQNPTGICMSNARRQQLLALAERHGFLIIEDDIYGQLSYDNPDATRREDLEMRGPIKAHDRSGSVVYLSSFSKSLMPALRIGFVVAPPPLHERLISLRRAGDLCGSTILQRALALYLRNGGLKRHLRRVLPVYRERRDALLDALDRHMPSGVSWTQPRGGFCCWLTLPRHHALTDIHRVALEHGLAVAPGEVFLAQPDASLHLRLAFGCQTVEAIRSGVGLLGELIRERLEHGGDVRRPRQDYTPLV